MNFRILTNSPSIWFWKSPKSYFGWMRENPGIQPCYHFNDFPIQISDQASARRRRPCRPRPRTSQKFLKFDVLVSGTPRPCPKRSRPTEPCPWPKKLNYQHLNVLGLRWSGFESHKWLMDQKWNWLRVWKWLPQSNVIS